MLKVATASAVGTGMLKRKKLAPASEGAEIPEGTGKKTEALFSFHLKKFWLHHVECLSYTWNIKYR
jgi:hypothetical protein